MKLIKLILWKLRRKIWGALVLRKVKKHENEIFIGGKTRLTKGVTLGKNPNFNGMTVSGYGEVVFGDNFHSGKECLIITSNHNYDYGEAIPYDKTDIKKKTVIGDNVWFGDRVIVLPGVCIGEGAIIQAGSVVSSNIPSYGIAGGNPARVFKYRDIDHYNNLKFLNRYH